MRGGRSRWPAVPGCLSIIVLKRSRAVYSHDNIAVMAVNSGSNPATHFGKQMKKERTSRGWTLRDFSARTGIDIGQASRIENGRRPPTEKVAMACDAAFPERQGWFMEYYSELGGWSEVPAAFRDWAELEGKAARLHVWQPGIIDGLLQTEAYARALIDAVPGVTADAAAARLAGRMERQRRVLTRDRAWFIIDELCLYRAVGSAETMAAQLRRLREVAAMPTVTLQVLPAVAHCANASAFIIADGAAYAEHVVGGYVFTDEETVTALALRFDTLRGECYRVSDTAALLERLEGTWTTGGNLVIRTATAGSV
ncbi:MAG: putative transcriptional regulator, family [Actinomycetia bacterium]|nr:putative transcriptional regulator, family [Actinomycetes bacterium]